LEAVRAGLRATVHADSSPRTTDPKSTSVTILWRARFLDRLDRQADVFDEGSRHHVGVDRSAPADTGSPE
jgi:hypothetical protein